MVMGDHCLVMVEVHTYPEVPAGGDGVIAACGWRFIHILGTSRW